MRILPAGVAYGVWTGAGSVGITLTGILWFKEKLGVWGLSTYILVFYPNRSNGPKNG